MLSFNKPITIGSGKWKLAPFRFYNKGEMWSLGNGKVTPDWREITLKGVGALSLVNAKKDGLTALKLFGGTEQSGTPSPTTPMDIVSNNGVLKVSMQLLVNGNLANGTTNWDIPAGIVYTDTKDYAQFYNSASNLVYCRCLPPTRVAGHKYAYLLKGYVSLQSGNASWGSRNAGSFGQMSTTDTLMAGIDEFPTGGGGNPWVSLPTGVTVYIDKSAGFRMYDLTALGLDTTITTAEDVIAYFGEVYEEPKQIKVSGTVETVEVTGNLVDFNETRINSSTWDSADKTKGFEVYADVYSKSVGDSMLTNANAFGVFVPCAYGKSVSMNFFNYLPFTNRALYCEITADRKCNTSPVEYFNTSTSTWNNYTFTVTKTDSIGFIIEFYISSQQTRNYTKENYTVIKGTTQPTSYIPYFNGGTATAEMLLKVGDYKDEQSVVDGNVTHKVGIKVLDGTEEWRSYSSLSYPESYYIYLTDMIETTASTSSNFFKCSHFTYVPGIYAYATVGYCVSSNKRMFFRRNYGDDDTLANFKQWLADQYNAGTPVIVVYPTSSPVTEQVAPQSLTIQQGTNIIEITEASINNLPLEVSYKAGVSITIQEITSANLDNSVQVTIG